MCCSLIGHKTKWHRSTKWIALILVLSMLIKYANNSTMAHSNAFLKRNYLQCVLYNCAFFKIKTIQFVFVQNKKYLFFHTNYRVEYFSHEKSRCPLATAFYAIFQTETIYLFLYFFTLCWDHINVGLFGGKMYMLQ